MGGGFVRTQRTHRPLRGSATDDHLSATNAVRINPSIRIIETPDLVAYHERCAFRHNHPAQPRRQERYVLAKPSVLLAIIMTSLSVTYPVEIIARFTAKTRSTHDNDYYAA